MSKKPLELAGQTEFRLSVRPMDKSEMSFRFQKSALINQIKKLSAKQNQKICVTTGNYPSQYTVRIHEEQYYSQNRRSNLNITSLERQSWRHL